MNVHSTRPNTSVPSSDRPLHILEAALELVAEHGLTGFSVAKLAKRAGASPGILYHYFDGKDALLHTCYRVVVERFAQALGEDIYALPGPERLEALWLRTFHFYAAHPRETVFLEQYKNSAYYALRDKAADAPFERLLHVFQADIASGTFKALPLRVIQAMTLDVAIGLAKAQVAGTLELGESTLETVAATICQAVVR